MQNGKGWAVRKRCFVKVVMDFYGVSLFHVYISLSSFIALLTP